MTNKLPKVRECGPSSIVRFLASAWLFPLCQGDPYLYTPEGPCILSVLVREVVAAAGVVLKSNCIDCFMDGGPLRLHVRAAALLAVGASAEDYRCASFHWHNLLMWTKS